VSSQNFHEGDWFSKTKHKLFNEAELKKHFIPVDFSYWNLMVVTAVDPRTVIPEHSHTEAVFRYITRGSMELNGVHYSAGDWLIVPANFTYSIRTREGYTALAQYHENCVECTWEALSKMPLEKME